jgi:ribonuclease HII
MRTTFQPLESRRRAAGYTLVAGVDEVGRGAWAGPLVAAALILKSHAKLPNLRDSKQLTAAQREVFAKKISERALASALGVVEAEEIDKIGIGKANKLAFTRALEALRPSPHYVLADYFSIHDFSVPVEGVRGGDERVRVVAAASVIAKVYRDNLMTESEERYPGYGFSNHKGYGTREHRRALKKLGPCPWHRRSFDVY